MCGIAGLITSPNVPKEKINNILKNFVSELNNRGPDDSGIWADKRLGVYLAHTRLSIVDLSKAGSQPMESSSGRYVISFNGEIYNHKEIRANISKNSSSKKVWKGYSDTEVLLESIELFGLKKTLEISRGMFAFSLWDKKSEILYLIRDRFGEKPLYWGLVKIQDINEPILVFASEINAILKITGVKKKLNNLAIHNFFNYGYIPSPLSIQDKVNQLNPGCLISIPQKLVSKGFNKLPESEFWWDPSKESLLNSQLGYGTDLVDLLESLLIESISLQSRSEVPICTFLSGGLDSTLISTLYSKISSQKINTFTISFPDEGWGNDYLNEGSYSKKIANYLGTNHNEMPITSKDAINIIPSLSNIYGEPFSDSSQIPTYLICKEAKQSGFKVALTGDGGDELFGGYNRHFMLPKINNFGKYLSKESLVIISRIFEFFLGLSPFLSIDKKQKFIKALKFSYSADQAYYALISLWEDTNILLSKDLQLFNTKEYKLPHAKSISEKLMLNDLIHYLPNDILVKVDRASMSNSLETRSPLLDPKIASFAWNIPLDMKIPNKIFPRNGKFIFQEILKKNIPPELFKRPKTGFSIPIADWLRGPLVKWADELLAEDLIKEQGFLNPKIVQKIWNDHKNRKCDNSSKIWSIIIWQNWLENNKYL